MWHYLFRIYSLMINTGERKEINMGIVSMFALLAPIVFFVGCLVGYALTMRIFGDLTNGK